LWAREKDWKAVFEVFIFILFLSHHSSSLASALFSICYVFSSAILLSASVQKTRSSAYSRHWMPGIEFSSPIRSFMYRLNPNERDLWVLGRLILKRMLELGFGESRQKYLSHKCFIFSRHLIVVYLVYSFTEDFYKPEFSCQLAGL